MTEVFRKKSGKRIVVAGALALGATLLMAGGLGGVAAGADPANLSITKSDDQDPVNRGDVITYTIVVNNAGPDPATSTEVEDKLPGGLNFVSMATTAGTCARQGKTITCSLGTLAVSATETVTIRARVTKRQGSISNTATVDSAVADPVPANNSDTEQTTIRPAPSGPTCAGKAATIVGTAGNNTLLGTGGRDVVVAGRGNDVVLTGAGRDLICAGGGADLVRSGPQGDVGIGGGGPDRLVGRGGADSLRGKAGNDRLRGNRGPDFLAGGLGRDVCRGGPGADTLRSCP